MRLTLWRHISPLAMLCCVSAVGCSNSPLPEPAKGANVLVFPPQVMPPTADPQAKPFGVARHTFGQAIALDSVFTVVFDADMIAGGFGTQAATSPLSFSPPIEGDAYWWGARTLTFRPHKALTPGQTYTVTLDPALRSAADQSAVSAFTSSFKTPEFPAPKIYTSRSFQDKVSPETRFTVQFAHDVTLSDVREHVELLHDDSPLAVDITTTKQAKIARTFTLTPKRSLPYNGSFRVRVTPGIRSTLYGTAWKSEASKTYQGIGEFKILSVDCGMRGSSECYPNGTLYVRTSSPVKKGALDSCIRIDPSTSTVSSSASWLPGVTISPTSGFDPGQRIRVGVKGACKDQYNRPLANALNASISIKHEYARLDALEGFHSIKHAASLPLDISTLNVSNAQVRLALVTPTDVARLNLDDDYSEIDAFTKDGLIPGFAKKFKAGPEDKAVSHSVDLNRVLGGKTRGLVFAQITGTERFGSRKFNSRALFSITDLGVHAKTSAFESLLWVTTLGSAKPSPQASVEFFSAEGASLWSGATDAQGLVKGPGYAKDDPKRARYAVATKGDDTALINLDDWYTTVPLYRFDSPDTRESSNQGALAHLFTERGVYRPGEPVHIKGLVRALDSSGMGLPQDTAIMTVKSGRGDVVFNEEVTFSALGGVDATLTLDERAPLGWYSVALKPSSSPVILSDFRVEAYRAPTFEVTLTADEGPLRYDKPFKVGVQGRYFFGAPMSQAPLSPYVTTQDHTFSASAFEAFSFSPELWWNQWGEDIIPRATLDYSRPVELGADGRSEVSVTLTSKRSKDAMMMPQRVSVDVSVNDVDGQEAASATSVIVHPSDHYVGLKTPGYVLKADTPHAIDLVAVDLKGAPIKGREMILDVYRRQWISVKKKSAGGTMTWDSRAQDTKVASCTRSSSSSAVPCELSFEDSGSYIAHVRSTDTTLGPATHARAEFYVWSDTGRSWWRPQDGPVIKLVADKDSYRVGDRARILVQSPFDSAQALVTIEREGVMRQQMMPVTSSKAIEVEITQDMMPNAFVSVSLLRPGVASGKQEAAPPAFKIGYASLKVETSSKKLDVGIDVEPTHRPGAQVDVNLNLKDAQGRPISGEVTLMAVQEGVLQLTGYTTPNPHKVFYDARGLGVTSHSSVLKYLSSMKTTGRKGEPGGDGGGGSASEYRNDFATTAAFLPTVVVPESGSKAVSFKLPDDLTSYRIMAVAVGPAHTFGSAQQRITVNKPLLVRPSLPRFATMGDTFKVRAVVQGMEGFAGGEVQVRASTARGVRLVGETTRTVTLKPGQSELVSFDAIVEGVGEPAQVSVSVEGAGAKDGFQVELPLRYSAPMEQSVGMGMLTAQKPALWREIRPLASMHKDVGELEVTLSSSALSTIIPSLEYVVGYPYGCAEQVTSRTLPMVWLQDQIKSLNIATIPSDKIESFVQSGLDSLFSMQTPTGGLGYWPGDSTDHPWASAYAGLAIVQAHNTGYRLDPKKYEAFLAYMKSMASGNVRPTGTWRGDPMLWSRVMASYVLSMAGQGDDARHDTLYEQRSTLPAWAKGLLLLSIHKQRAGGVSSDRQKAMLKTLYDELMQGVTVANGEATLGPDTHRDAWLVMSSVVRSDAIGLMASMAMDPEADVVGQFATSLLRARRQGRWASTQSNAFASIALSQYFQRVQGGTPDYTVHVGFGARVFKKVFRPSGFKDPALTKQTIRIPMSTLTASGGKDNLLTIAREGLGGALYYTLTLRHAPATLEPTPKARGFQVKRQYLHASGPNVGKPVDAPLRMGDTVVVRLSVVAPGQRHYVALDDPLPPGFEIVDTSMKTTSSRYASMADALPRAERWIRQLSTDYVAKHDDRVEIFTNDLSPGVYTYSYLVRATTPGSFNVSGTRIHEMYQPGTMGRAAATSVEITP